MFCRSESGVFNVCSVFNTFSELVLGAIFFPIRLSHIYCVDHDFKHLPNSLIEIEKGCCLTVYALVKKYFTFMANTTFVNVNITIPIKYALTRSTETFTQKCRSSKAN